MSVGIDGRTTAKSYGYWSPTVSGMSQTLAVQATTSTAGLVTVQTALNTARGALGANSAALAATADYLTDLTAMYEIGYNTVNDVNFSLETAILAKNQIFAASINSHAGTGKYIPAGFIAADPGLIILKIVNE